MFFNKSLQPADAQPDRGAHEEVYMGLMLGLAAFYVIWEAIKESRRHADFRRLSNDIAYLVHHERQRHYSTDGVDPAIEAWNERMVLVRGGLAPEQPKFGWQTPSGLSADELAAAVDSTRMVRTHGRP